MAQSKRDALLAEIADAKERRLVAVESDASVSAVRAIEDEIAALRARQREAHPEMFESQDTDKELRALREQQVAELSAMPNRQPWQEANLQRFGRELAALKGRR